MIRLVTQIGARFAGVFGRRSRHGPDSHWVEQPTELGADSLSYLDDIFRESFSREEENNESVWRSLPFFAAAVGLAVNFLSQAAADRPEWFGGFFAFTANLLLWLAITAFAWTLRWFWELLRPRRYQYPPDNREIWTYAEAVRSFHAAGGVSGQALDAEVARELKAFMARQYGDAACSNMDHNRRKFQARSQLLLFILLGFFLVIASEGTKYLARTLASPSQEKTDGKTSGQAAKRSDSKEELGCRGNNEAKAADASVRRRGCGPDARQLGTASGGSVMTDKAKPTSPPPQPVRPPQPAPQLLKKNEQSPARPTRPLEKR